MSRSLVVVAGAAVSCSLFGCGQPDPEPTPYKPNNVAEAWANHFEAFGEQDVDKILKDYTDASVVQVHNDACSPPEMAQFTGKTEITDLFVGLFETLTSTPDLDVPTFGGASNPTVEDAVLPASLDSANVFLVWSAVGQGIEKATDTFTWTESDGQVVIEKQNIVVTQPAACSGATTPAAPSADPNSPITQGWDNHFAGFGAQDKGMILADYTEDSTVQVYTWGTGYEVFQGLTAIGNMFDSLWADMNAQTDVNGTIGLGVPAGYPRVEVGFQSVFLTWYSFARPKATDTFLFDSNGKILRQTIVVTTGTAPTQVVV